MQVYLVTKTEYLKGLRNLNDNLILREFAVPDLISVVILCKSTLTHLSDEWTIRKGVLYAARAIPSIMVIISHPINK